MAIKKIKIGNIEHELQTTIANITDLTATATELNYMDGVTSKVQTQLDGKLGRGGGTLTGNLTPNTAVTKTLGSSTLPFATVCAKNYEVFGNASKKYGSLAVPTVGTTTTNGVCSLALGNGTASGTADNAYGRIIMYGTGNGYTRITTGYNGNSALDVKLPDRAGTLLTDKDLDGLASVSTLTTAEYTALEQAQATNANTLYMLTDAEEEGVGDFIINATIDANGDGTVDKTAAEITAALDAGHSMVCNATYGTSTTLFRLPLLSSRMLTSTVLSLVFATQNYKVTIRIVDGSTVNVSGEIVHFDITIGDTIWSGDEPIDFTDTINGMIDAKQNSNIFIAEYGVTTFVEIFEAVQENGKTAFCRTSEGSILPLAYAYLDGIKFVGNTYSGEQEAICTNTNVWSLNDVTSGSQDSNIFIAEYGTTTYQEIIDANTAGKTIFCRTSTGSVLPLAYAHITGASEIKFVGNTDDGEREVVCSSTNVWSINDIDIMAPQLGGDTDITLTPDKLFYYAQPDLQLNIKGAINTLPNGWFGFLTVYAPTTTGSITTSILETTSENGFTFTDIGNMESYSMAIFKTGASTKLKWYLFKPLPSAEGASF